MVMITMFPFISYLYRCLAIINEADANPENADIQFELDEEDIDEI